MSTHTTEWRLHLYKDLAGQVTAAMYECGENDQWSMLADERFGPFDTASDIAAWMVRHWAPRARLPLR